MPGTFESAIQLSREGSKSLRTTIPEGIATALEAADGGSLVWTLDLKAGRVTVTAKPPDRLEKSSKHD